MRGPFSPGEPGQTDLALRGSSRLPAAPSWGTSDRLSELLEPNRQSVNRDRERGVVPANFVVGGNAPLIVSQHFVQYRLNLQHLPPLI